MIKGAFRTSFAVVRHNWLTLVLLLASTYWPLDLLRSFLEYQYLETSDLATSWRISRALDQLVYIVPDAAIYYIAFCHLAGDKAEWAESLSQGLVNYGRMWVTRTLYGLSFLSLLLLVVPGVYWLTRWSLCEANVVYEGTIGTTAFERSWQLTGQKSWRVLGALAVGGALYGGLSAGIIGLVLLLETDSWWLDALSSMFCSVMATGWLLYICGIYAQLAEDEESRLTTGQ